MMHRTVAFSDLKFICVNDRLRDVTLGFSARSSAMSKGASLAPQEIRIDFAVLPETNCQGLFNQIHRKLTKGARSTVWLLTPHLDRKSVV